MEIKQNPENPITEELPRNVIFTGRIEQAFLRWYHSFFSIAEIESSRVLQWVGGALLFTYYVSFSDLVRSNAITIQAYESNTYRCWSYFQNCGEYYFLTNLPHGYSQPILYVFFFGLMLLTVFLIWKKDWVLAHILILILFLWKFLVMFVLTSSASGNYDYYDIIFSIIFLLLPYKLFFLKLSFVLLYFLSTTIKIHEGWILGTYFTALKTGLPIFPDSLAPLITNIVIGMQMIGAWFLLSSNKVLQRTVLVYFVCFHLYSGILVYYRYLSTALPMLLILFGPLYSPTVTPLFKKSLAGWVFISLLISWQFIPHVIAGDQKMTLEANRFGIYMFEANHQCVSTPTVHLMDGTIFSQTTESASARSRCDPYKYWFELKQNCLRHKNIARISWTFDHSINGGPFYRIVDSVNMCELEYKTFKHNTWIKLPTDNPSIIGYPVKNVYY